MEKVLGIKWVPGRDLLGFTVTAEHQARYNRVGLTSKVATPFNPLGSSAPLLVKAKIPLRTLELKGL